MTLLREKVAILGYVQDTMWEAPFDDKHWTRENGCEIWGLNDLWRIGEGSTKRRGPKRFRYDRWFEIHTAGKSSDEEIDWLAKCGVSVYMNKLHPKIAQSIRFPLEDAVAFFRTRYFTNTISFELALAIMEGFKEIHLYGVNMAQLRGSGPPELRDQRASIEFFLGWAMRDGIRVVIPASSDLLKTAVIYGFEEHADSPTVKLQRMRDDYLEKARVYAESAEYFRGAASALKTVSDTWLPAGDE